LLLDHAAQQRREHLAYTQITLDYAGARPAVTVMQHGKPVVTHPASWSTRLWTGRPAGTSSPSEAPA
jgi:hypothetical protein